MDNKRILEALNHIDPDCEHQDWIKVGMSLHAAGMELEVWEEWSEKGDKYKEGECAEKWKSFDEEGGLSIKTLFYIAEEYGWQREGPMGWGGVVTSSTPTVKTKKKSPSIKQRKKEVEYQLKAVPNLVMPVFEMDPLIAKHRFLKIIRKHNEGMIFCLNNQWNKQKYTLVDWETEFESEAFHQYLNENTTAVRICPSTAAKSDSVTDFRYCLLESDEISKEIKEKLDSKVPSLIQEGLEEVNPFLNEQWSFAVALQLPIVAAVYSGGKSIHFTVKVDADSIEQFKERITKLHKVCSNCGFIPDASCKDPVRYNRVPGSINTKYGSVQKFVYDGSVDCGFAKSWQEWETQTLPKLRITEVPADNSQNDSQPETQVLEAFDPLIFAKGIVENKDLITIYSIQEEYWFTWDSNLEKYVRSEKAQFCTAYLTPLLQAESKRRKELIQNWHDMSRQSTDESLQIVARTRLKEAGKLKLTVTQKQINDVYTNLASLCGIKNLPFNASHVIRENDRIELKYAGNVIRYSNTTFFVDQYIQARKEGYSHIAASKLSVAESTQDLLCRFHSSHEFDPEKGYSKTKVAIQEILQVEDGLDFLSKMFGLCLVPDTDYEVFFTFDGKAGTGKSTLASLLEAVVGKDYTSAVRFGKLNDRFSQVNFCDNLINCPDEMSGKLSTSIVQEQEDYLKTIVSGGSLRCERKCIQEAPNRNATARLIFTSNGLPYFNDRSEGIWRRLRMIPCNNIMTGRGKRIKGFHKLLIKEESSGIINWALDGLYKLYKQHPDGNFPELSSGAIAKIDHREESDPISDWLKNSGEVVVSPEGRVRTIALVHRYQNKEREEVSLRNMASAVKACFNVKSKRIKTEGQNLRFFLGIKLAPDKSSSLGPNIG